jgi:UDP-glucose 4-epimerase
MKCLVTGGAGFIGSHIVDALINQGADVLVCDNLSTGRRQNLNPKARFVEVDIRSFDESCTLFDGVEYVFHAAALPRIQPSFDQPIEHEEVNVIGTIKCLLACNGRNVKKFVLSGSSACYGNPRVTPTPETEAPNCLSPYALQKYAAEQYCLLLGSRFDIPVISLRYFNVYGPRSFNPANPYNAYSSVIGIFHEDRRRGTPLTITGDGTQKRDFVHVADVARASIAAALSDVTCDAFNVGSGVAVTIRDVAAMFYHPSEYIPKRQGEAEITLADITKIRSQLNWMPTIDLLTGIRSLQHGTPQ